VYVNGHGPYRFLLDTGSTLNHLDPKLAKSIGLDVTFHTVLTSSTGRTAADGCDRGEIRLGPASADGQAFLLTGMEGLHQIATDIQGVLGQAFLSRFDYRLDLRSRRLEFGARPVEGEGTRVPFRVLQGRPVVTTSLGSLVLDSGAHYLVRFHVSAAEETLAMATSTGSVQTGTVFSKLMIDERTFWRGEAIAVPQTPETGADGLLPISPFKSIYINNSEHFLVVE
jgi:hypothetical protein